MTLRQRLAENRILIVPGVYDTLGGLIAERVGCEALYVSGASLSYSRLGQPDIGLFGLELLAEAVGLLAERCTLPILADADTGFGNPLNVQRVVRLLEARGANAIQLEDQSFPKRCGHLAGKSVIPAQEMVGKLKAALDARRSADTLIVARTDAVAVEGLEAGLERATRYREAGADILFIEALPDRAAMETTVRHLRGTPLVANMVEGGRTPLHTAAELEAIGFAIALCPGAMARIVAGAASELFAALVRDGSTAACRDRMLDFFELNTLLGTETILEAGRRYDVS